MRGVCDGSGNRSEILFEFTSFSSMFALVFTAVRRLTELSRHFGNRVCAMRSAQVEENPNFVATIPACTDNQHENEFRSLGKCRYTAKCLEQPLLIDIV